MGKSPISTGPFSIAMLNSQRVCEFPVLLLPTSTVSNIPEEMFNHFDYLNEDV
jgi:hypothetical protein